MCRFPLLFVVTDFTSSPNKTANSFAVVMELNSSNDPLYRLCLRAETVKLARAFGISNSNLLELKVVVVELFDPATGNLFGRGECRPYKAYTETQESVMAEIEKHREFIENGEFPSTLYRAAANAVDCALLDAECKQSGVQIGELIGIGSLPPTLMTGNTISLHDDPLEMGKQASDLLQSGAYILKIKLGSNADGRNIERLDCIMEAVRNYSSSHTLVNKIEVSIDFNAGCLTFDSNGHEIPDIPHSNEVMLYAKQHDVKFVEQPFPPKYDFPLDHNRDICESGHNDALISEAYFHPVRLVNKQGVPILADESCHTIDSLSDILGICQYDGVNMKLGKTGGLRNGMQMVDTICTQYPNIMLGIGSMASSSLSAAADYTLAAYALYKGANVVFIDIDSPTLVGKENDREHAMHMEGSVLYAPSSALWGGGV